MIELNVRDINEVIPRLRSILDRVPEAMDAAAEDAAKTMLLLAEGRTPVGDPATDRHSGQAKRAWSDLQKESGGYAFSNPTEYITILEEGGYQVVGPRTVAEGGNIYSKQAPGGILDPLTEDSSVLDDIAELIATKMIESLRVA